MTYQLGHRPALDGLRGVAILLVVAGHMAVPGLDSGGWPGVTLFFALSGFLITSLLLEERQRTGGIRLRAFYERRARRLLPALALFLGVMILWGVREQVLPVVFYVSNWTGIAERDGPMAHLWSLAVEEQFYIVWPVALLGLPVVAGALAVGFGRAARFRLGGRPSGVGVGVVGGVAPRHAVIAAPHHAELRLAHPREVEPDGGLAGPHLQQAVISDEHPRPLVVWRHVAIVILVLAALAAVLRVVQFALGPFWLAYTGTHSRADALLLGCALAIALHAGMTWRPGRWLVAVAAVVIAASAFPTGRWQNQLESVQLLVGLPLTAIASTILVAAASTSTPRALTVPPLRGFGKISYGLYLWHSPLAVFGWLGIGLSVAVSTASYLSWERRWLRRDQLVLDQDATVEGGRTRLFIPLDD